MASLTRIFENLILVIEEEEVKSAFPLNAQILHAANRIARAILISPSSYGAYDKSSINFSTSNPISLNTAYSGNRLPTKLRPMMGAGRLGSWVKALAANEIANATKRSYSTMQLVDKHGKPLVWMGGDSITDFRTAASAAVGIEALTSLGYSASILGVGNVGKATAFALQALETKPRNIVLTAKSKRQYGSIAERIQSLGDEWGIAVTPAESLENAVNNIEVVIDAIAAPHYCPVVTRNMFHSLSAPLLYVDAGKQSISAEVLLSFQHFFVDTRPLARLLPSPLRMFLFATEHETAYEDEFLSIGRAIQETLRDKKCRSYYGIIGVPLIDAAIAEYILKTLALDDRFRTILEQALPTTLLDILYNDDGWF